MKHINVESIYREIILLSDAERNKLYNRIRRDFYQNDEIVAYTARGKPMTKNEYIEQINLGLKQIENGEVITDEELQKEIETW
ncbi:MAG: hypothetical protein FWF53_04165 [Candidatus Azobacteroides sp.]|nr:hypothetical protein [Candidatus Azobacteroides sp.]